MRTTRSGCLNRTAVRAGPPQTQSKLARRSGVGPLLDRIHGPRRENVVAKVSNRGPRLLRPDRMVNNTLVKALVLRRTDGGHYELF